MKRSSTSSSGKQQRATQSTASSSQSQALKEPEDRLSQEAYKICIPASTQKENIFPYIPISSRTDIPIEDKYAGLKPAEIAEFYTRQLGLWYTAPKSFIYYQQILTETGSVIFEPTKRGHEVAYSKLIISKVITPEEWPSPDLFSPRELKGYSHPKHYNYMDYIQAWESALYYDNRQSKFSWWIQFKIESNLQPKFPNWFISWFQNWGIYPIIMPLRVRAIYDEFVEANPSSKQHRLLFAYYYQVPWIIRWEFTLTGRAGEKFGESLNAYPCLGRRTLSKWWDKYDFFENTIYTTNGIKSFEPKKKEKEIKSQPSDLGEILKVLAENFSKEELIGQLEKLTGIRGKRKIQEEKDKRDEESDEDMETTDLQDSQDPYDFMQ